MKSPSSSQIPTLEFDTAKLLELQKQYVSDAAALWQQVWTNVADASEDKVVKAPVMDRRFASDAWRNNPIAAYTASAYLINARALQGMAEAVQTDAKTKARIRYAVEQFNAAASPSNYLLTNAEALQKAIATQGESLNQGIKNFLADVKQGHISMTDESQFEVGKNVATTEGAVVFENELFQLIEYKALTKQVYERPFLLVPPCINKFYILDLQPDNSLIRYAVAQGHRTFVLSWRNPDASLAGLTWDNYVEDAAIKAITTVQAITGAKQINVLGFCVGGTILASALAVLAARGEKPAASLTLLTSMLDFSDTGILDIFIDEESVRKREMELADPRNPKLLKGQELASSFSFLRPNDLVWNYVVGNYLKGETPPAFDLLYWNSDSTNLPGPMYSWYLRHTYLENNLIKRGKTTVCGEKLDFNHLDMPTYIYGSQEDHIVPVASAYASTQIVRGKTRFVMGASGHIAGVINPPAKNKRAYWTYEPKVSAKVGAAASKAGKSKKAQNAVFPATHKEWYAKSTQHPGSWWTDWSNWLNAQAGKKIAAPKAYGSGAGRGKYRAIEPAPGRYVRAKA